MDRNTNGTVKFVDNRHARCIALVKRETIKLVSFDLFDTLIVRKVFSPKDLFHQIPNRPGFPPKAKTVDFAALRVRAEHQLRKRWQREGRSLDPTLDMIYEEFHSITRLDEALINAIKKIECAAEVETAEPRMLIKQIYDAAIATGKHVAISTDMYLPRAIIDEILKKCGYDADHHVYLSSEVGFTKKHGTLYPFLARTYELEPDECAHFGDNVKSDVKMAEKAGWNTMKIWSIGDSFLSTPNVLTGLVPAFATERDLPGAASKANYQLIANRLFGDRVSPRSESSAANLSAGDFGYTALGPFLLTLCLWILRLSRQKGMDHVAFLARDGHLPIEAARLLAKATGESTELSYLPISRRVLFPYFVTQPGGLERVLSIRYDPRQTVEAFLKERLGAGALELFESNGLACSGVTLRSFMKDHHDYVCGLLRDNLDALQIAASEDADNLLKYYRATLPKKGGTALFDVGRKGTFQAVLSQITGQALHGFYVVTDYAIMENAPGRAFDSLLGMIDGRAQLKNPDTILYEALLSEKGGSYIGFEADGSPRRAEPHVTPQEAEFFDAVHDGALDYIKDAIEAHGDKVGDLEQESFYAAYGLEHWPDNKAAVELLSSVRHEDSISSPEAKSLKDYFIKRPVVDDSVLFPPKGERKRIMIYSPALTRIKGGAERIAARLANHLCGQGYEVLAFSSGDRGGSTEPVYPLEPGVLVRNVNVRDINAMSKMVAAFQPDCGLVLASGPPVIRLSMAFLQHRVPYLLSERASPEHALQAYWKGATADDYVDVYEAATLASVQFDSFRDAFPEHMQGRVEVLSNPIVRPPPPSQNRERLIVCAARIWFEQKRQDILLRAFARVANDFPDWRLSFFGAPKGVEDQNLRALAQELGVEGRVEISGPIADIHAQFEKASIFVLPSKFEGFPNALAEALSAGAPSVGFASCPGTNELIINGENGVLVDDKDIDDLRNEVGERRRVDQDFLRDELANRLGRALAEIMGDKDWRTKASKAAYESMARYDEKAMNKAWEEVVVSLSGMDGALYATQRLRALEAIQARLDGGGSRRAVEARRPSAPTEVGGGFGDYEQAVRFLRAAPVSLDARARLFVKKRFQANGAAEDAILFDTLLAPRGNIVLPIPEDFDETAYLAGNADVAVAVAQGQVQSGYVHYVRFGAAEGRKRPTRQMK